MRRYFIILIPLLLFAACSKDHVSPTEAGKQIFKLTIDPNYQTGNTADWLIIHDTKGKLLFSKLFESGDTVIFNTSSAIENSEINITLMKYYTTYEPGVAFNLISYLQIPLGEEWTLKNPVNNSVGYFRIGSFNVLATDVPSNTAISFSDKIGRWSELTPAQNSPGAYRSRVDFVYPAANFLLTTRDALDNLRYKFIDSVKSENSYTFSYLDMVPPETILPVSFPQSDQISFSVSGFDRDQPKTDPGYTIGSLYEYQSGRTKLNIGYLDRFDYYHTLLRVRNSNGYVVYDKMGSKSTSISLPFDAAFELTNLTVGGFSFNANKPIIRRVSNWIFNNNWGPTPPSDFTVMITWTVNAPAGGDQRIGPFPDSFSSIYPDLKTDKLTHYGTTFFLSGASSYSDAVDSTFKDKSLPQEHELYSVIAE